MIKGSGVANTISWVRQIGKDRRFNKKPSLFFFLSLLLGLLFPSIVGLAVAFFSLYSSSSSFRTHSLVRSRFSSSLILRILMKIFASSRPYLL